MVYERVHYHHTLCTQAKGSRHPPKEGGPSLPVTSQWRACGKEHLAKNLRPKGSREVLVGKEGIMISRGVENVSVGSSPPYTSSQDKWRLIGNPVVTCPRDRAR
jgi:hypothetical protein